MISDIIATPNVDDYIEDNYRLFSKANLLLASLRTNVPTKRDLVNKNNINITYDDMFGDDSFFETYLKDEFNDSLVNCYMTLPCFKEGVYKIGFENGDTGFYHYKFLRQESEENIEKYIFEINFYDKNTDKTFNLNTHMIMSKTINTESFEIKDDCLICKHGYEIYRENDISKSDLIQIINFPEKENFQEVFLRVQEKLKKNYINESGGEKKYINGVMYSFTVLNLFTNYSLMNNKLHTKRSSKSTTKVTYEPSGKPQPKVLYRTAGKIKFHSSEIPRCATEEVVRHYTCMSWQQRGHVRRYKSGKEVWIKPCVKRRQKSNNEPPIVKLNIV